MKLYLSVSISVLLLTGIRAFSQTDPWGWVGHGAATLIGGAIGGFTAEAITTKIYDYKFQK